jgi:molybdate transport system substrate-binding protein
MKNTYKILIFLVLITAAAGFMKLVTASKERPETTASKPIVVFAAAGTTAAMQDIAAFYPQQSGVKVQLNLASSATLAKQIAAGADWDVYISANRQWMKYVVEQKSLKADSVVNLLKDRLALIEPADGKDLAFSINDSSFARNYQGQISLGDPAGVPVGIYAKQTLEKLGWWQYLGDNVIPAVDVAAALRYVETGQCQAGIVYLSGVKNSSKVRILHVFDESLHEPIYFNAVVGNGSERGKLFLDFLTASTKASELFTAYGFETVIPER